MWYIHSTEKWIENVVKRINELQLKPENSMFMIAFFSSMDNDFVEYFKVNKDRISSYSGQNFHIFTPLIYEGNTIPDEDWRHMKREFQSLGIPISSDPTFIFFSLRGGGIPAVGEGLWTTFEYHPDFFAGFTCHSFTNFPTKLKAVIDCCVDTKHTYELEQKLSEIFLTKNIVHHEQIKYDFAKTIANKLPKSTLFISHSSIDKPFARRLVDDLLKDKSINVWIDEKEILAGDDIQKTITKNLRRSDNDHLLIIISEHSTKSSWVNFEVSQFMGFSDGKNIIPIVISKGQHFPEPIDNLIRRLKYLDFTDDNKWEVNIEQLKQAIKKHKQL